VDGRQPTQTYNMDRYGQALSTTCRRSRAAVVLWHLVLFTLPNQMTSVFSESNSCRICHSTSMPTLLVLSASFNYDNYAASDVLLVTTLSLHSFMRSSQAESIIAVVSWLALRRRRPTSCNVSSTRQHESSRTRASSTGDSLISGERAKSATLAGRCRPGSVQSLRPGVQMFAQDGSWIPVDLLPTRLRHLWSSPLATCDRLTVVISTSHVWNLLRTEDVYLHTPALQIGTQFLLTLETIVFLFHLLSATSKPFSSLSIRLAHAAHLRFFFFLQKNALYKFSYYCYYCYY